MTTSNKSILQEQDIANTLLCDLKRVVREYATAASESNCPTIRDMNTKLLNTALKSQGDLFMAMKAAQLYDQPIYAQKTVIKQQVDSYKQTEQKLTQFLVSQQPGQANATGQAASSSMSS